jgi:hypothetical protein
MPSGFVTAIDFIGTFAFAISGATAGVRKGLDLFGVLVLAFAAGTAGGIARDTLLGATPPVALVDARYFAVTALAGLATFYRYDVIERMRNPVQLFDAVGLGLFAVIGAGKALDHGLGAVGAVMLGILTGIGGGMVRDVLTMQIPNSSGANSMRSRRCWAQCWWSSDTHSGCHRRRSRPPGQSHASSCASSPCATAGNCRWRRPGSEAAG